MTVNDSNSKGMHRRREEYFEQLSLESRILCERAEMTVETTITAIGTKKDGLLDPGVISSNEQHRAPVFG
jgi:hypothetical protein